MNDEQLQQLLLQTAETPPGKVWENIAVVLTEDATDQFYQLKLLGAEEAPASGLWNQLDERLNELAYDEQTAKLLNEAAEPAPSDTWNQIELQLADEDWKSRLLAAQTDAPVLAWTNIELELAALQSDQLIANKLKKAIETAPSTIWPAVEKKLSVEQDAVLIPVYKRLKPFIRMAAAAMVTGILAWGVYQLFSIAPEKETATVQPTVTPKQKPAETSEAITTPVEPTKMPENTTANISPKTTDTQKKNRTRQPALNSIASNGLTAHTVEQSAPVQNLHHKKSIAKKSTAAFNEDQYLLVMDESGGLIRVSKKLTNLKCAGGGTEIPVDAMAALESRDCYNQIKQWQKKMATTTALSPFAGFIDVKEMINAVEK